MGIGDDIISTSVAKKANLKTGKLVMIGNGVNVEWSKIFSNNPRLSKTLDSGAVWVRTGRGCRPYINYAEVKNGISQAYNYSFRVEPGELFLTEEETDYPQRDFVLIEPNVKGSYGGNKDWGFLKWQKVIYALPGIRFIQCGNGQVLDGVEYVRTQSFRNACGLLSHANLFVGTDGALHHAAAALGKRGIVLWGGLAPPSILGYDTHKNICYANAWCGSIKKCGHCSTAMDRISVEEVVEAIRGYH